MFTPRNQMINFEQNKQQKKHCRQVSQNSQNAKLPPSGKYSRNNSQVQVKTLKELLNGSESPKIEQTSGVRSSSNPNIRTQSDRDIDAQDENNNQQKKPSMFDWFRNSDWLKRSRESLNRSRSKQSIKSCFQDSRDNSCEQEVRVEYFQKSLHEHLPNFKQNSSTFENSPGHMMEPGLKRQVLVSRQEKTTGASHVQGMKSEEIVQ